MADSVSSKSGGEMSAASVPSLTRASGSHTKRFMEGPLSKWTNVVNGWQYRWFVLDQNAGLLSYYTVRSRGGRDGGREGLVLVLWVV